MWKLFKKKTNQFGTPKKKVLDQMLNNLKEIDNFDKFTQVVAPITKLRYQEDFSIDNIQYKSEVAMQELSEEITDHFGFRHPTSYSAITQYFQIPATLKKGQDPSEDHTPPTRKKNADNTGFNIIEKLWYSCY
jgi:hypothetical protein